MYPEVKFKASDLLTVPRKSLPLSFLSSYLFIPSFSLSHLLGKYWNSIENRRKAFDQFAASRGFDPLVVENWYPLIASLADGEAKSAADVSSLVIISLSSPLSPLPSRLSSSFCFITILSVTPNRQLVQRKSPGGFARRLSEPLFCTPQICSFETYVNSISNLLLFIFFHLLLYSFIFFYFLLYLLLISSLYLFIRALLEEYRKSEEFYAGSSLQE